MIGIINYGMGNLASVYNALHYLGIESEIISNPRELKNVEKIILPGVGAFGQAMVNLNNSGFANEIKENVVVKKKHILGICLGMQLLLERSVEYGDHEGLGIIRGQVLFFGDLIKNKPVPHMGWNEVGNYSESSILFKDIQDKPSFYFVHSYYCKIEDPLVVSGKTEYEIEFDSSCEKENIFGCQFHPEKSQLNGLAVLKNFNSI